MMRSRRPIFILLIGTALAVNAFGQERPPMERLRVILEEEATGVGPDAAGTTFKCGMPLLALLAMQKPELQQSIRTRLPELAQRPSTHRSRVSPTGRFRVHFDTTGQHEPALLNAAQNARLGGTVESFIDSVITAFEYSWDREITDLGFDAPPSDQTFGGGPEYDIYVQNLGSQVFGYTEWQMDNLLLQSVPNERYTSYIVIDNDYLGHRTRGIAGLQVTAAHEFHHAIQIGAYGFWKVSAYWDLYFYEITSTWMEDVVYDDVNDYYFDLVRFFQQYKDAQGRPFPLTMFSGAYVGYERAVVGHFLEGKYGQSALLDIWTRMKAKPFRNSFGDFAVAWETDVPSLLRTFALWNYHTAWRSDTNRYYPEGLSYPLWTPNISAPFTGTTDIASEAFVLSCAMYDFRLEGSPADTLHVLLTNGDIAGAIQGDAGPRSILLRLSDAEPGIPSQDVGNGLRLGFTGAGVDAWRLTPMLASSNELPTAHLGPASPNPWDLATQQAILFPVLWPDRTAVDVLFLSSSLDRIHEATYVITGESGRSVIRVPASDLIPSVSSGVYFVIARNQEQYQRWKIAIIR